MPFERILVPTDFSEAANEAAAWGATLADRLGGRLTLLHVLDLPEWSWSARSELGEEARALQVKLLEDARERTRAQADALPGADAREVSVRARAGAPAREILAEVREASVDLVVLSTHGRRGLANALLGSVAEKLVRTCPCPVLTVKAGESPPEGALSDVLFATDLSEASLAALKPAAQLAAALGGTLTALHVLEEPRLSIGTFEEVFGLSPEAMQERLEKRARRAIREQIQPALPEGLSFQVLLAGGEPHEEIVREAAQGTHGLVVMATRGRSNLGEALLGSTAERVVRTAGTPVLTVRAPS